MSMLDPSNDSEFEIYKRDTKQRAQAKSEEKPITGIYLVVLWHLTMLHAVLKDMKGAHCYGSVPSVTIALS